MSAHCDYDDSQFRLEESGKKKTTIAHKSNQYSVITYQKRLQLINLASNKGYSISKAARQLGIKTSTGKFIVKCFRDNGKIMKKTIASSSKQASNSQEISSNDTREPKQQKTRICVQEHGNQKVKIQESLPQIQQIEIKQEENFAHNLLETSIIDEQIGQLFFYPNLYYYGGVFMPQFYA